MGFTAGYLPVKKMSGQNISLTYMWNQQIRGITIMENIKPN